MVMSFKIPNSLKLTPLVLSFSALMVGCGGSGGSSNKAPAVSDMNMTMQSGERVTQSLGATDADGDTLTYTITQQPAHGTATIADGKITYSSHNVIGQDSLQVTVSDGKESAVINVAITLQAQPAFSYQFYRIANPDTGNQQIVRYDPNDSNDDTNQQVIKNNVVLGDNVFVMSGVKEADKTVLIKREYGIFLDPNTSKETRTMNGRFGPTEYTFYFDNILKKFDATDTSSESTIFDSTMLPQSLTDTGIAVIGEEQTMHLNQIDIDNSYVTLMAYDEIADINMGELSETKLHVPLTVRLSDSSMAQGRMITYVADASGATSKVLMNFVAPHSMGNYPDGDANAKRLQVCDTDLQTCHDLDGGAGNYFMLGQNTDYVYMAKDQSSDIVAYNKMDDSLTTVTGVSYPAEFDHHHHTSSAAGHGGNGVLSNFSTIGAINNSLAEGDSSYVAINYDLDTDSAHLDFVRNYKHSQILKLSGTSGTKVYDNGDGVDDMNMSTENGETAFKEHVSLVAVKDGNLFMEASYIETDETKCVIDPQTYNHCVVHYHAALNTNGVTTAKTEFDVNLSEPTPSYMNYLAGKRVPARAIGDDVYFSIWDRNSSASSFTGELVYNVYKMPFTDLVAGATLPDMPTANGRMFMERTATRSSGVYDGSVVTWHGLTGEVRNITTDTLLGLDENIENDPEAPIVNVYPKSSNDNTVGVAGLMGVRMASGHGGPTFLTSAKTGEENSLKAVNNTSGIYWIID